MVGPPVVEELAQQASRNLSRLRWDWPTAGRACRDRRIEGWGPTPLNPRRQVQVTHGDSSLGLPGVAAGPRSRRSRRFVGTARSSVENRSGSSPAASAASTSLNGVTGQPRGRWAASRPKPQTRSPPSSSCAARSAPRAEGVRARAAGRCCRRPGRRRRAGRVEAAGRRPASPARAPRRGPGAACSRRGRRPPRRTQLGQPDRHPAGAATRVEHRAGGSTSPATNVASPCTSSPRAAIARNRSAYCVGVVGADGVAGDLLPAGHGPRSPPRPYPR